MRDAISLISRMRWAFFLLLFTGLQGISYASAEPATPLHLLPHEMPVTLNVSLDDNHWQVISDKSALRVGTWAPENPPFDILSAQNAYEGIYADYIQLISRSLGLTPVVLRYPSRDRAAEALKNNEIDLMADDGGSVSSVGEDFISSTRFITNLPVMATRKDFTAHSADSPRVLRIAVSQGYLRDQQIQQYLPDALIVRFTSDQRAITCVALQQCDVFIGNLVTTSFLIDRNYNNVLSIRNIYPEVRPGFRFLFRNDDLLLQQSVNAVLQAIPEALQRLITRNWVQREDIWRFEKPLKLSEQEKAWIKANPTIKIIVDPFFAPYSMVRGNGEFYGISAEILRLIGLRTGLKFETVTAESVSQAYDALQSHRGDVIAATGSSQSQSAAAVFTRPWYHTPSVLVVRNEPSAPSSLSNHLTLAAVKNDASAERVAGEWPGIRWIYADNTHQVLQMVNSGKADAGVTSQLGASFMTDREFSDKLKIARRLGEKPELISFAVRREAPELLSILNKAIAEVSPQEVSLMVQHWQEAKTASGVSQKIRRTRLYWGIAICAGLMLLMLTWAIFRGREIRRRRQAQEALQAQLAFRDTLLNGSPAPIYVLNPDFTVITYNQAFMDYFSRIPAEHLRYSLFDFRHPLYLLRESLTLAFNQDIAAVGIGHTQEFVVSNGAEDRVIAHWATPYFDLQTKVIGLICGWQDITVHKQLLEALSSEKENAEQASQAKSTFLSTMSHEIRTPISAILGLLELEVGNQPANDAIRVAYESAQTLMGLIGDVLDLAKIESGELVLLKDWARLSTVLTPVIRVFEEVARQKGLELQFHNSIDEDAEVFVDGGRLRQCISNYLSNAVKFTDQGTISVRLQSHYTAQGKLLVHVEIEDTGSGISIADQKRLFKPFVQLEEGQRKTGSGLGLVISNQLLDKMQGSMQMRSTPGRGTLILVELPLDARSLQALPLPDAPHRGASSHTFSVLIVDDHPVNRMVLARQLHQLGHQVAEAADGEQGFELWQNGAFDLIITDCTMYPMDGYALTRKIRDSGSDVPVFGLTANAQPATRDKGIASGMNDCIFKPLRLSQLESVLRQVLATNTHPALESLLELQELKALLHHDEDMLLRLLQRICKENEADLAIIRQHFEAKEWERLAGALHKLAGAAQVIYAHELDALCNEIETLCATLPVNEEHIRTRLSVLESQLRDLHFAIKEWMVKL